MKSEVGPVFALRPDGAKGRLSEDQLAWKLDTGTPDVPTPLISEGLVYLSGENGRLTVLDETTGEKIYGERVHQSQHRGSPVLADGKLYLTGTDGTVSVVRAGRTFELLSKNKIDGGRLSATPAISLMTKECGPAALITTGARTVLSPSRRTPSTPVPPFRMPTTRVLNLNSAPWAPGATCTLCTNRTGSEI